MLSAYEQLKSWVLELTSGTGVKAELDEEGYCRFYTDDGRSVILCGDRDSEIFYIFVDVLPLPLDDHASFYEACLVINLDQGAMGGASLSVDLQHSALVLSFATSVNELSFTEFNNALQNLVSKSIEIERNLVASNSLEEMLLKQAESEDTAAMLQV